MRLKKLQANLACSHRYRALARNANELAHLLDLVYKELRTSGSVSVTLHVSSGDYLSNKQSYFLNKLGYNFTQLCISAVNGELRWCDFPGNKNRSINYIPLNKQEIEEIEARLSDGFFICVTPIARLGLVNTDQRTYALVMVNRARHWLD